MSRTREALALDWPCPVQREPGLNEQDFHPTKYKVVVDGKWDGGWALRFDDYGELRGTRTIVDPHFGALGRGDDPITPSFFGPRWAPLRSEIALYADRQLGINRSGPVFTYGPCPDLPQPCVGKTPLGFNARKQATMMAQCSVAVVPPSMVALECLAIGLPVVLYVPGPKWQPIADAMKQAGVAEIWSGKPEDHTLACVLADDGKRKRMAEAGREHVDGRGAERLAEWLADA